MKKIYKLEDLECACCAEKMKTVISKLDGVTECNINFMAQKLTIEADENKIDSILKSAQKEIKKIEPDCRIVR